MQRLSYKVLGIISILLGMVSYPVSLFAQCTVKAYCDPTINYCGFPFNPTAIGKANSFKTIYSNNFNSKSLGSGWGSSTGISFDNPCGSGDGSPCAWMVSGSNRNRNISTTDFDVSKGGKVCFDFRMADVNGTTTAPPNCEAPDQPYEGVYFQFSTNGGNTWTDIFYFDPTPFPNTQYTAWNNYCFDLPPQAIGPNTRFRWYQAEASGDDVDHWGFDNVEIKINDPDFEYIWDHTPVKSAKPGQHVPSSSSFTYHVTYKNALTGEQCEDFITVQSIMPTVQVNPDEATICNSGSVALNASYFFANQVNSCGLNGSGCMGNSGSKTIGGPGSVNSNVVFNNASSGSNKAQFIIRSGELGTGAGQITGLALTINDNGTAKKDYYNFRIKVGCTGNSTFSTTNFVTNVVEVLNENSWTFNSGKNIINFEKYYNWDGLNNLVIEICWSNILLNTDLPVLCTPTSYNSGLTGSGSTNSTTNCNRTTGTNLQTNRPVFDIFYCALEPRPLSYSWTPSAGLSNDKMPNPTASPTQSTEYTVVVSDAAYPHCKGSATASINIRTTDPGKDTAVTVCRNEAPFSLYNKLAGSPPSGGTWTDPTGAAHNGQFNPASSLPGTYRYTLSDPDCGTLVSKIAISLETPPNPGVGRDTTVCQTSAPINVMNLIGSNPQAGGTLKDESNSGAFTNPNFDPSKVVAGTYTFSYTVPKGAACPEQKTTLKITVTPKPNSGSPTTLTICNSAGVINLFNALNGSPQGGGSWTNNNNVGTLSGNSLDVSGIPEGSYTFTYTIPASNGCAPSSTVLTLQVINQPNAGADNSITVCQTEGNIILFTKLNGSPNSGGTWTDMNNSGAMTPQGVFNAAGVNPGTYSFRYTVGASGCPSKSATVTVKVNKQNYSGTGRDTSLCATSNFNLFTLLQSYSLGGTWKDTDNTGRLSGSSFNPVGLPSGIYKFDYSISSQAPCVNQNTQVKVSIERPADAGNGKIMSACKGEVISMYTHLSGNPAPSGTWLINPSSSALNSTSGVLNTANLALGTYEILFVVSAKSPCVNDTARFTLTLRESPKISNVSYTCINQNREYRVEFDIVGGDAISYTVNPAGTLNNGVPRHYTSNPIASQSSRKFYVSDQYACGPDSLLAFYDCGCITFPGTFKRDTLSFCENKIAKAPFNNDQVNDGNDTLLFVLHSGSSDSVINPLAYNSLPEFAYTPSLNFYQTYYISSIIADKKPGQGLDYGDTCYQVAPGTPIQFKPIPKLNFSFNTQICQGDSLRINYQIEKGRPPIGLTYNYDGQNQSLNLLSTSGYIAFKPSAGGNLALIRTTGEGCSSFPGLVFPIEVNDSVSVSQLAFSCNADNNQYQIDFSFNASTPSNYNVVGLAGTFNGANFTSSWLNSGDTYTFRVDNGGVCPPITFTGNYACPCLSNPGSFTSYALQKVCGSNSVSGSFRNDKVLDGNDAHWFILHSDSAGPGNILAQSASPVFTYFTGLTYGTRYYISAIAGDSLNGFIDLNHPCTKLSRPIPVEFYPEPSGVLNGDTSICEGISLDLKPILQGFGPFQIILKDQDGKSYPYPSVAMGSPVLVKPPVGTHHFRFLRLRDLASGCFADTSGGYTVRVTESPKLSFGSDQEYCEGQSSAVISFNLLGSSPFQGKILRNGALNHSFTSVSSSYSYSDAPQPGIYTYTLGELSDASSAACPGFSDDSLRIEVFPIQSLSLSGKDSICEGASYQIPIVIAPVYSGYSGIIEIKLREMPSGFIYTDTLGQNGGSMRVNPGIGWNQYQIISVKDLNSGCDGLAQGIFEIFGIQAAQLVFSGDSTFCDDGINRVKINISSSGIYPLQYYFSHNQGGVFGPMSTSSSADSIFINLAPGLIQIRPDSVFDGSSKACKGIVSGLVRVQINQVPRVSLVSNNKPDTLCQFETFNLIYAAQGNFPITAELWVNGVKDRDITFDNASALSIPITPQAGSSVIELRKISDNNSPSCGSISTDTTRLFVLPRPDVLLSLDRDSLCSGELLKYTLSRLAGQGTIRVDLVLDGQTNLVRYLSGNQKADSLLLSDGLHQLRITNVSYFGGSKSCQWSKDSTLSIWVRPSVDLNSFAFMPDTVCVNALASLVIGSSLNDNLTISLSDADSTWQQTFQNSLNLSYGPIITNRWVRADSLWYATGPRCVKMLDQQTRVVANPAPTAFLYPDSLSACEGDTVSILLYLEGAYSISGSLGDYSGQSMNFISDQANNTIKWVAKQSGAIFFSDSIYDRYTCASKPTDSLMLKVNPLPKIAFDGLPRSACTPLVTQLINMTDTSQYQGLCLWAINGQTLSSTRCDTLKDIRLEQAGDYTVSLTLTSKEGCVNSKTAPNFFRVHPLPEARFSFTPNPVYVSNTRVQFLDQSLGSNQRIWNFNPFGFSSQSNPVIEFPADPELVVDFSLIALSDQACTDTIRGSFKIIGEMLINIPNSFTPDGDGINDYFSPVLYGIDTKRGFEFEIFNRWGERIFYSRNPNASWDGSYMGVPVQTGVYSYRIVVANQYKAENREIIGHINLLR